ncbi:MAG: radical SAM protein [Acidimicrobiia bacterium]
MTRTRATLARPQISGDFSRAPFTIAWEITRACPLRCVHCRADAQTKRRPDELTTGEGLDLVAQAAEMGTQVFVITGGDPLARPDAFEFIGAAASRGMHVGFSPSVTPRLTPAAMARAVDAGAGTIHLSLDGARPETHDGFRGVTGSFERTLRALDAASELEVRVQVGTTVSRRTVADLPEVVTLLAGRVELWSLFFLVPTGRAEAQDLLSPDAHERVLRWLATADIPFPARTIAAPTYRRVRAQLGLPPGPGVNDGNGFCFVSHTGDVCPSGFLQLPAGNLRDAPLAHWYRESPLFRSLRDPALLGGKCGRCDFRQICGGSRARAWGLTGDPLAEDPTCAYQPGSTP